MVEAISPSGVKNPSGSTEAHPLLPAHAGPGKSAEPPGTTWQEINALAAGVPLEVAKKMDPEVLKRLADLNSQDFLGS